MLKKYTLFMALVFACKPNICKAAEESFNKSARTGNASHIIQVLASRTHTLVPNTPDAFGMTPLHYAAKNGHEEIIRIFLEHGLSIQIKNSYGLTPTDCAKKNGKLSSNAITKLEKLPIMGENVKDMRLLAEISQSQAGFTCATDGKPIVATFGCGPCVALGGYDQVNHTAFVVHFAKPEEVRSDAAMITDQIKSLMHTPLTADTPMEIHIHGGWTGLSEDTVQEIKNWVISSDIPMKIQSQNILGLSDISGTPVGRSLAIDSRTGAISEYDPTTNPYSKATTAKLKLTCAWDPHVTIAYKASR